MKEHQVPGLALQPQHPLRVSQLVLQLPIAAHQALYIRYHLGYKLAGMECQNRKNLSDSEKPESHKLEPSPQQFNPSYIRKRTNHTDKRSSPLC